MSLESIIEKIEEEAGFTAHDCVKEHISDENFKFKIEGLKKAIEIIKESDKAFSPEDFGFIDQGTDINFPELENLYMKNNKHICRTKGNEYSIGGNSRLFKINTNHEAQIIFKALGIIE